MKFNGKRLGMLLHKSVMLLAITLFSVISLNSKVEAAAFKYSDFNWSEFLQLHNEFWTSQCHGFSDLNTCKESILFHQEEFYTKMYQLLAKYQDKKNLTISDALIVATVFADVYPSHVSSNGEQYITDYSAPFYYFNMEKRPIDDTDIDDTSSDAGLVKYLQNETDTLKLLIKSAIAYRTYCFGFVDYAVEEKLEDGSSRYNCPSSINEKNDLDLREQLYVMEKNGRPACAVKERTNSLGQWDYLRSKFNNSILGILFKKQDIYYKQCEEIGKAYPLGSKYVYDDTPYVDYDKYFEFLHHEPYFDRKYHLQDYFKPGVLEPAGAECMATSLCGDKSIESMGLYDTYKGEIEKARLNIIRRLISILNETGTEISYSADTTEYIVNGQKKTVRDNYYWPIGGTDITEKEGHYFANGEPESKDIISYFGKRNDTKGKKEDHYGIDISGKNEVTNVIAVYYGEIVEIVSNCTSGDLKCNGGLGNSITISHSNGDYTIYGGLSEISSYISLGMEVKQGEYLGKVGNTGNKTTDSLHFELRIGGNDVSYSVDPLSYFNISNPRPNGSTKDFDIHHTTLTKEEFVSKLNIYCQKTKCSDSMKSVIIANAELIYIESVNNNLNPEFVVVRAMSEGFSPGSAYNNYWGIGCTNGEPKSTCNSYIDLASGIRGLANLKIVQNAETASKLMLKYAYIGKYWYNPNTIKVDWGLGGCPYFIYIAEYMSPERSAEVSGYCKKICNKDGSGECALTNDEDQLAYATWQVEKNMGKDRYNIFGL